jgi:hypothetical protein
MRRLILLGAALVIVLGVAGTADAQTQQGSGTVIPNYKAPQIVQAIRDSWTQGPYECSVPASTLPTPQGSHGGPTQTVIYPPPPQTFVVTATEGECAGRQLTMSFRVTSQTPPSDSIKIAKNFLYVVTCNTGTDQLEHDLEFCTSPGPACSGGGAQSIDSGSFVFDFGGDVVTVSTTEEPLSAQATSRNVPAMGPWGIVLTGLAVLAFAVFLILRRSSAPA